MVKVLYAPNDISNQTIAATLEKYGKIVKVEREMYRDWPNVETGFGQIRATCLENRRQASDDRDDQSSENNLSNDIGHDEDGSDVYRSSDEDMDRAESTSCKDPGGIRDAVMLGITNTASQHHPTEQGTVQTVENNKRKAEENVSIPEEGVSVPEDPTDQCVSDMGGSPEDKTKKTDKGKKKKRGKNKH
ncbi:Hypothetical predicted protein [Paramuricea clavata]|uniref:Uncharacterized protein n=1 Tax=Paramuricea clavata TaxID=317549 RepID=A0A6S7ISD1_PARCT|nr:Hypothetical predicted protein [Paramuricea clavata]